jgi:hypothetical protein
MDLMLSLFISISIRKIVMFISIIISGILEAGMLVVKQKWVVKVSKSLIQNWIKKKKMLDWIENYSNMSFLELF